MLSEDDGRTFPYTLLLDGRSNVSYPDAVECEDGSIYLVYDRERGCFKNSLEEAYADAREILLSRITEEDILAGEVCGEKSFLRRVVSRLDRLDPEDGDPYEGPGLEDDAFARFLLESKAEDPIAAVFERYPLNCSYIGALNAVRMDAMINRFREGGCSDVELLTEIIGFVRRAPQKKERAPVVDKIKQYIEAHVAEDFSVRFLAETMNISLYYLSHLFKAVTGITVIEYRNELRMKRAKELLLDGECQIGEIAALVGFESIYYFSRAFKKAYGLSPSQYAKGNLPQIPEEDEELNL